MLPTRKDFLPSYLQRVPWRVFMCLRVCVCVCVFGPLGRYFFFFQAEDGIRGHCVTGVQTCALPILDRPDLVGYSLGGGVALQTAAKYPVKVGRLVAASANIRADAIYPEMRAQQRQVNAAAAEFMKDTPMYQLYQRVAPRPQDFPRLLDKIGESMSKDFDFTEDVRSLKVPTLIVAADADMAPPSHYVELFKLLGGGLRDGGWTGEGRPKGGHALAILPGRTHYNIFSSPLLAAATLAFLDEQPS